MPAPPTETALVTGATGGIGLHVAQGLVARGFRVFVTGRDETRGRAAETALRAGGGSADFLRADHATRAEIRSLAGELSRRTHRLDVLVNNVGALLPRRQETADGLEATLAINFVGPALLTRLLAPLLAEGERPRVVDVVSSALFMWKRGPLEDLEARDAFVGLQIHAHAKLLNAIWTLAFARKMAGRVSANAVNPGMAWTPLTQSLTPEAVPAWRYIWPLVRFFQRRASAEAAAAGPLALASSSDLGSTGRYFDGLRAKALPTAASDEGLQEQVWTLAASLGGLD